MNTIGIDNPFTIKGLKYCCRCKVFKFEARFNYNKSGLKLCRHCKDCAETCKANYEFGVIKGIKTCRLCGIIKFTTFFAETHRGLSRRDKYGYTTRHGTYCKECSLLSHKKRQLVFRKKVSPAKREAIRYKRRLKIYGLTKERFIDFYNRQGGKCAICRVPALELIKGLYVDHCHESNEVRGLLCGNCNTAIGHLGDKSGDVERALKYLVEFESKRYYPVSVNRNILFKNKR